MKNSIKWIFFDMGGVLLDDSQAKVKAEQLILAIIQKINPKISLSDVQSAWIKGSPQLGSLNVNVIKHLVRDKPDLTKALAEYENRKSEINYYITSKIRPEAKEVLLELAKKYKLGLIANQNILAKEKLKEAGIYDLLHHQTVSDENGLEKPDPKYFQAVFKETGANPNESVIVDDNIERALIPGKKLGMTTVWYKFQERTDIPKNQVNFTITSLADLLDYCPLRCHSRENGNSELEQYLDPRS